MIIEALLIVALIRDEVFLTALAPSDWEWDNPAWWR